MVDGVGVSRCLTRRGRITVFAVLLMLACGTVSSQPSQGALSAPDLADAYPAARSAVAAYHQHYVLQSSVDLPGDVVERLFFVGELLRRFTTLPSLADDAAPLCAFTAGAGGSLQVDGGGGRLHLDGGGGKVQLDGGGGQLQVDGGGALLQPRDARVFAASTMTDPFGVLSRDAINTGHVVIVDTFDLGAIQRAVQTLQAPVWPSETTWHTTWRGAVTATTLVAGGALLPPEVGRGWIVPHGHVVLHQVLAAVTPVASRFVGVERFRDASTMTLLLRGSGDQPFRIDLVAISYGDMATVSDAMRYAADAARSDAVVVTSWGLTDCALRDAYLQDRGDAESLAAYLRTLIVEDGVLDPYDGGPSDGLLAQLCEAFAAFMPEGATFDCTDDVAVIAALAVLEQRAARALEWPLTDADEALRDRVPYDRVFASSGNQRLPFPMPPAAWPGVFGVAACEGPRQEAPRAWYSNVGDFIVDEHVVARGSWYSVRVPDAPLVGYWGTSYAAPLAALAIGLEGTAHGGRSVGGCAEPLVP